MWVLFWIGPLHTFIYLFHSSDSHCHRCMALNRKETIRCVAKLIFIHFVQKIHPTKSSLFSFYLFHSFIHLSIGWVHAVYLSVWILNFIFKLCGRTYDNLKHTHLTSVTRNIKDGTRSKAHKHTHDAYVCWGGEKGQSETVCLQRTCLVYTLFQAFGFSVTLSSLFNLSGFANILPKLHHRKTEKMCLGVCVCASTSVYL